MVGESIIVDVAISRDEWLRVYTGEAFRARGVARDGRSVVFPAGILQPFMDQKLKINVGSHIMTAPLQS